jgi:hypothetical protein
MVRELPVPAELIVEMEGQAAVESDGYTAEVVGALTIPKIVVPEVTELSV